MEQHLKIELDELKSGKRLYPSREFTNYVVSLINSGFITPRQNTYNGLELKEIIAWNNIYDEIEHSDYSFKHLFELLAQYIKDKNSQKPTVLHPSSECMNRMMGVTSIEENNNLNKSIHLITKELMEDGFEKEEIISFFMNRVEKITNLLIKQ